MMMYVFRNNRGFTLVELMVATAMAGVLSLIATISFSIAMDVFVRTSRLIEAETEMLNAMYAIKSTFVHSVNVVVGGVTNADMLTATNPNSYTTRGAAGANVTLGKLYLTNFNPVAPTATPSTYLIALTLKEANQGFGYRTGALANAPDSKFVGVGVYFTPPALVESGALYIDQESHEMNTLDASGALPAKGGWVYTSPASADQMYTRFTEFAVENVVVRETTGQISTVTSGTAVANTGKTILSAEFRMNMRYFTKGLQPDWRWCTSAYMPKGATPSASCSGNNQVSFKEVEKRIKVVFNNNSYDRSKYLAERPLGYIYYFKNWSPASKEGL